MHDLKSHFNIPVNHVSINDTSISNDSTLEYDPFDYCAENKDLKCLLLSFNIELTETEWKSIYPETKVYKDKGRNEREYKVLKSGWTDVIAEKCFESTKIPCAFIFKFAKIFDSPEAAVYLHIRGICHDCGASFDGHCLQEPASGDGIILSVRTYDTRQIPHSLKRPVKGSLREKIGKELIYKKPRLWRNEALEKIAFGDCEPPNLPRSATLRKVKEQATNLDLDIKNKLNVVDSLCKMKYTGKFGGYIKEVSKDKFYCFYWSPMQMYIYNKLIKVFKKMETDATGSLVKAILAENGERRAIFLYQMLVRGPEIGIQPVFQMLSEKHDANFISYWMKEILRHGAYKPPEVNCDYSMALLNATSLAYNEMSLKKYILNCFKYVTTKSMPVDLDCLIRVDIAHLIKIMCKKDTFKGTHPQVKDFFVRCVGIMSTCDNIQDLSELLKSTLIVAGSEYSGNDVVCGQKYNFLMNRIKTFTFKDKEVEENDEREYLEDECDDNQEVILFLEKIREDSEIEIRAVKESNTLNTLYCPTIIDHFMKLARHFPLWTNLMLSYFPFALDVASSARCESYFKNLKHGDLGPDYRPVRADKFVSKHIKSIESIAKSENAKCIQNQINAARSNTNLKMEKAKESKVVTFENKKKNKRANENSLQSESVKKKIKYDSTHSHLEYEENWFGKNWEAKKKIESSSEVSDFETDGKSQDIQCENVLFTSTPLDSSTVLKNESTSLGNSIVNENKKHRNIYEEEKFAASDSDDKENCIDDNENCIDKKKFSEVNEKESPLKENGTNRMRGKYLRACPNIELIYNKPLRRRHGEIISNGSKRSPVLINGTKIYIKNTCSFDSVVEVLASCYSNYSTFKNEIDIRMDNIFFSLIAKYAQEGVSTSLYNDRAEILCMYFENKNDYLDCYGSATVLLEKLVFDTPSLIVHKNCSTCKIVNRKIHLLSMAQSHAGIDADFESHLKNFVSNIVGDHSGSCRKCNSQITTKTTVGPYLIIEPEIFLECNRIKYPKGIPLHEIPTDLTVKNVKSTLGGLVRHSPGHFSALCRHPNNSWYQHDDLCKKAAAIKKTKDFAVSSNIIFYIKI